ncbi:EAL domain-containing protein [Acinetobacter sp. EKM10A]|nr:EAL domain-containing protein [Acinetobacter sp. EKM10A]
MFITSFGEQNITYKCCSNFLIHLYPSIYAIVQAIGLLAPNLSLGLIAEGIETPEQEELLLQFGYNIGQGFLFESAIDANQVISILKQGQAYLESHYSMN